MKLLKIFSSKFSIIFALAMTFAGLATSASAQQKIYCAERLDGVSYVIGSANSKGLNSLRPTGNNFLVGSSAAAFQTGNTAGRHPGGINVIMADGSVRFSVKVFEVLLPNSPLEFDRVDAQDANAATKIRMIFDAAERMRSAVVLIVPKDSVNIPAKFRTAQLTAGDDNKSRYEVKMQDVLVSSWSNSSSSANDLISIKFASLNNR